MTSNLVSGMLQRIEKLRKYAFASVLILGEDNNNSIEGVWVTRGQQLAFDVSTTENRFLRAIIAKNVCVIQSPGVCH